MNTFTPSIKRLGTSEQDQLKLGVTLAKEGRLDEALSAFETATQLNPESVVAHLAVGNLLFRQRSYTEALTHFEKVMQLDPLLPMAPLRAGGAYTRQENFDKAIECFETALNLDPQSTIATVAAVGMGQVYIKQQKYDSAIQQFRQALRLNPQMMMARLMLASALKKQGNLQAAISELKAAINISSAVPVSYLQLGSIYLEQKNYSKAKTAFETADQLDPKVPAIKFAVKFGLAESLIEENELQSAVDILRQLPENKLYAPRKHKLFGDVYSRQGLVKEAAEEYRAATLLGSSDRLIPDEDIADLEALEEQDRWEELLESYRSSANAILEKPKL